MGYHQSPQLWAQKPQCVRVCVRACRVHLPRPPGRSRWSERGQNSAKKMNMKQSQARFSVSTTTFLIWCHWNAAGFLILDTGLCVWSLVKINLYLIWSVLSLTWTIYPWTVAANTNQPVSTVAPKSILELEASLMCRGVRFSWDDC